MSENVQNCFVDFVGATFRLTVAEQDSELEEGRALVLFLVQRWFPGVVWKELDRGMHGYAKRIELEAGPVFMWGGNCATVHVEIQGDGCSLIRDWNLFADDLETAAAKLTRIDLAHDDLDGETFSIAWAQQQYHTGGFKPSRGLSPNARLLSDEGSGKGSTYYVGSRESGKLARIYEKGKQLGDALSRWCRVEVEWRSTHRELSVEMLRDPSPYLSGAYKCLGILGSLRASVRTFQYKAAASLDKATHHAKMQAGRVLRALLELTKTNLRPDGDIAEAARQILRPEMPPRLLAAVNAARVPREGCSWAPFWWRDPTEQDKARTKRLLALDFKFWRERDERAMAALGLSIPQPAAVGV